MTAIQRLPAEAIAQIKSSATIPTLGAAAIGLLKNSLDAGATRVNVLVDWTRGDCTVEDDGAGIPAAEFQASGGLGKQWFTSNYPPDPAYHARHGCFLASAGALSLLTVASHHKNQTSHNSLRIHDSVVIARSLPAPPEDRLLLFPSGTRVTIRDLFGRLPVRVKQRPQLPADRPTLVREWEALVRDVVALVLAWRGLGPLAVFMRDLSTGQTTTVRRPPVASGNDGRLWTNTRSSTLRFARVVPAVLAQAGLFDVVDDTKWVPLSASSGPVSVRGVICLHPAPTRRLQFISLGITPIPNEHGSNLIHEEINRAFANSDFGLESDARAGAHKMDVFDEDGPEVLFTGRELKGRKSIDRWPVFQLRISPAAEATATFESSVDDLLDDRGQDLGRLLEVIRTMVFEFLKKHNFRPKQAGVSSPGPASGPSPAKRARHSKGISASPMAWGAEAVHSPTKISTSSGRDRQVALSKEGQRGERSGVSHRLIPSPTPTTLPIRAGNDSERVMMDHLKGNEPTNTDATSVARDHAVPSRKLLSPSGRLLRRPFDDSDETVESGVRVNEAASAETPLAAQASTPQLDVPENARRPTRRHPSSRVLFPKRLTLPLETPNRTPVEPDNNGEAPSGEWIQGLVANWRNPVFETAEPAIPSGLDVTKVAERRGGHAHPGREATLTQLKDALGKASIGLQGQLTKAALAGAQVVAQVDRKFILAKVALRSNPGLETIEADKAPDNTLLILVDQHAADERCRVEALMRDYFEVDPVTKSVAARTGPVSPPLAFDITQNEGRLLERFLEHFARWGIGYHIILRETRSKDATVKVDHLPPAIAERCKAEPRLLIDLMRRELWALDERGGLPATPSLGRTSWGDDPVGWVSAFHGCPQGVMDMLNSRACRSAIMFNDVLTLDECNDLVQRLTKCAFPFQCAHGRPATVALLDLGGGVDSGIEWEEHSIPFGRAFSDWKRDER